MKFEQSSGTPSRVLVLYERAVTDLPVASDLWLDYTQYLDKTLKVSPLSIPVFVKALSPVSVVNLCFSIVSLFSRLAIL